MRWGATHDFGKRGFADAELEALFAGLSLLGEIVLSSERRLPKALVKGTWTVPAHRLHDLMAGCRLHVGESATMAAEAAVLGVPVVYCSSRRLWYTDLLLRKGLVRHVSGVEGALAHARQLWEEPTAELRRRRDAYLVEVGDPVDRLVEAVEAAGHARRLH